MKKIKFIILLLLITILSNVIVKYQVSAQITFEKILVGANSDYVQSIQPTSDGGYIIVGGTIISGNSDVYLIKIDSNCNTIWTKTYGESSYDMGHSVQQTSDGGYIITGGLNWGGVYLIKTNITGDTIWTKAYGGPGGENGFDVQQTFDAGYIAAGYTDGFTGERNVFLIKTNGTGDTSWTKTYGGFNDDYAYSIQQTADSGYIVVGSTIISLLGPANCYLIKTDPGGNILWTKKYGENNSSVWGSSVRQTPDNGYIIVGSIWYSGTANMALIKTDANGDTLWSKDYGTLNSADYGTSVQLTSDGGYIAAGYSFFTNDSVYFYSVKTDANGDTMWTKMYGQGMDSSSSGPYVQQTSDGGYIFAGSTNFLGMGSSDIYLIKTDSNGNSGCSEFNTNTIVSNISFTISSGAITGSGTVVSNTATIVGNTAIIDSVLCCFNSPVGAFSYTDSFLTASFTDLTTGAISWLWDFGDGDTSILQNPLHTYDSASTYNVCLITSNSCGSDTTCDSVTLLCPKPISLFSYTDSLLSVNFSDSSTGAISWLWNFGDTDTDTTQNPAHTYSNAGIYTVTLIVSNACGTDTAIQSVTVNILGISEQMLEKPKIYPNPFSSETTIILPLLNKDRPGVILTIYDIFGRKRNTTYTVNNKTDDLVQIKLKREDLPSGIYFYSITADENLISNGKLIIE